MMQGRENGFLAPPIWQLGGVGDETRRRLVSAEDFVLKRAYDRPIEDLESLMETSIDDYLKAGEENLKRFQAAKIMVSKMIRLEDKIRKFFPDWNCDNLTDVDLKTFIERLLREEEDGLADEIIVERLKSRTYLDCTSDSLSTSAFANACREARNCCDICLEDYKDQDKIASLNYCVHEFHTACIKSWLLQKNSCPLCKSLALVPNHYPDWVSDWGELRAFFKRNASG